MPAGARHSRPDDLSLRAKVNIRERRDALEIAIVKRNPALFEQCVRRFTAGESVSQVAEWIYYLHPAGPMENLGYRTIRQYLTPLRARVRNEIAYHLERRHEPQVQEQIVEAIVESTPEPPPPPHVTDEITRMVDKQVMELSAVIMLKRAYIQQDLRVRSMLALEQQTQGVLSQNGYKEIETLKNIADSVLKYEMGTALLKNKKALENLMGAPGTVVPREDADIVNLVANMDEVDRNLVLAASEQIIDMVQENVSGRFKASGVGETNSGTEQPSR